MAPKKQSKSNFVNEIRQNIPIKNKHLMKPRLTKSVYFKDLDMQNPRVRFVWKVSQLEGVNTKNVDGVLAIAPWCENDNELLNIVRGCLSKSLKFEVDSLENFDRFLVWDLKYLQRAFGARTAGVVWSKCEDEEKFLELLNAVKAKEDCRHMVC